MGTVFDSLHSGACETSIIKFIFCNVMCKICLQKDEICWLIFAQNRDYIMKVFFLLFPASFLVPLPPLQRTLPPQLPTDLCGNRMLDPRHASPDQKLWFMPDCDGQWTSVSFLATTLTNLSEPCCSLSSRSPAGMPQCWRCEYRGKTI